MAERREKRLMFLQAEAEKGQRTAAQPDEIRAALEQELTFENGVNSALVTTILDHIVVKKDSTKEKIHLDIHLKFGDPIHEFSLCLLPPRQIPSKLQ